MKTFKYFKSITLLSVDKVIGMGIKIVAKVQKLGRIAIPQTSRDYYEIHEGDKVEIEILSIKHPNGMVIDFSSQSPAVQEVEG